MTAERGIESLLRELAPQALGTLIRRHGQFDACEDAEQEALLAAALEWPAEGVPDSPLGWLVTVGTRRLTDEWRSESARRASGRKRLRRSSRPGRAQTVEHDDTLTLLFMCCHPTLSAPSQLALTLRAVGGLTTGGRPGCGSRASRRSRTRAERRSATSSGRSPRCAAR